MVESLDGSAKFRLPNLIECDQIPSAREEIPTPDVAAHFPHLQSIAHQIAPLDTHSDILLLIGRDLPEAHHILDQRIGRSNEPYAQRLHLGWVIVGETCLGKVHKPDTVTTLKTNLMPDKRASIFSPCLNKLTVKDCPTVADLESSVFQRTQNDEKRGLSVEDREFLDLMSNDLEKSSEGNWVFPLPFRKDHPSLPDNRSYVWRRAKAPQRNLHKDPIKKQHVVTFMEQILEKGHAEVAPPLQEGEQCWYLPIFGVYHPKKPNQVRVVFDSSAKYENVSLNDALMTGPDMMNSLLGILLRFRKEKVAVTADIEKMFYGFHVKKEHRNFL